MNADQIIQKARDDFARLSKVPVDSVTGLSKTEQGWTVEVEALERKAIPDTMDMLGLYEIRLDSDGNLTGFVRGRLRKRGETKTD